MEYDDSLCKLVIRNIEIIENAPKVAESVDEVLLSAVDERLETLVKKEEWNGIFALTDPDGDAQFRPDAWTTGNGDFAESPSYIFWRTENTKDDLVQYWLSRAVQLNGSGLCLGFGIPREFTGYKPKESQRKLIEFFNNNLKLREYGFECDEFGNIVTRFAFDLKTLEDEYPDFDEALKPLDEAFDRILKAHPIFDEYVKSFADKGTAEE